MRKTWYLKLEMNIITIVYLLSKWNISGQRYSSIIIFFVIAHPNFSGSSCILGEYISWSTRECVRVLFPKYMSNSRTRNDFQRAAALPNAKWDLCKVENVVYSIKAGGGGCLELICIIITTLTFSTETSRFRETRKSRAGITSEI